MQQQIATTCSQTVKLLQQLCQGQGSTLVELAQQLSQVFSEGGHLLIGAKGSLQAVAQQIASEFVFRLGFDRPALPAICLGSDAVLSGKMAGAGRADQLLLNHYRALDSQNHLLLLLNDGSASKALRKVRDEAYKNEQPVVLISAELGSDEILDGGISTALDLDADSSFRQTELCLFTGHLLCELVEKELFSY